MSRWQETQTWLIEKWRSKSAKYLANQLYTQIHQHTQEIEQLQMTHEELLKANADFLFQLASLLKASDSALMLTPTDKTTPEKVPLPLWITESPIEQSLSSEDVFEI